MALSQRQFGIFYEDINHAADGGLYPELVQNRSFEFNATDANGYNGLTAWTLANRGDAAGTMAVAGDGPLNANNLNFLRVTVTTPGSAPDAGVAVRNSGFNTGVHVEQGKRYDVSFWARRSGTAAIGVRIAVEDAAGTAAYGSAQATITSGQWTRYSAVLTAADTTTAGRAAVILGGSPATGTTIDLDMVSLFPQDTFKGRPNGMRKDLAEKIDALHPKFLRFPGGCVANVGTFGQLPERARIYHWKETIGPLEERPTNKNFWGYNQTYGIGYLEYFQFAEDLGALPLPVVHVGMNACGVNRRITDPAQLAPQIQDTLDLIEFATGSVATEWGAKRAALGHPKPFALRSIALGNEESDAQFLVNYPLYSQAIRARHPDIEIISNSGPSPSGGVFERNWQMSREQRADLVDEHYYVNQDFLLSNTKRYDGYDRNGPHVFLGEYAARAASANYNNFYSALAEAAYITGIQRNSDLVEMASYAPLLANASYVNWSPDLIWFDNYRNYGTPSYYVQRMFAGNAGDRVVPTTLDAGPGTAPPDISGQIGVATWSTQACYDDVKVTAKDGSVLFSDDFAAGATQWTPTGPAGTPRGTWNVTDGAYCQTSTLTDARSVAGATNWSNYTLELTARKTGGAEGFLIMFGARDSGNFYWWNLGGFNNTQSVVEKAVAGGKTTIAGSTHTITTGQSYRLKIEVDSRRIALWIDGQKVNDFVDNSGVVEPLYQVVTRDADTGDVVVKAVNARATALRTAVDLGPKPLSPTATVTTLTAGLTDTNSFAEPTKVVPEQRVVTRMGNRFTYDFPANSVTFIRLRHAAAASGDVGGTVPPTLSLSLGAPASFGAFTPGVAADYSASTTANVISSAGDAALSVADPSTSAPGHLVNGAFSLPSALQARASSPGGIPAGGFADVRGSASPTPLLTYAGPISNDPLSLAFRQHIGAGDPLRTGSYGKTLTFTLATTTP